MPTEYRVMYAPNPKYKGDYPGPDAKGMQGRFNHLEKAEAAVESCKRYFNTEAYLEDVPHSNGSVTTEKREKKHDNVIVWIEELVDGVPVVQEKELAAV